MENHEEFATHGDTWEQERLEAQAEVEETAATIRELLLVFTVSGLALIVLAVIAYSWQ